jgi:hypothetical protein
LIVSATALIVAAIIEVPTTSPLIAAAPGFHWPPVAAHSGARLILLPDFTPALRRRHSLRLLDRRFTLPI